MKFVCFFLVLQVDVENVGNRLMVFGDAVELQATLPAWASQPS